MIHIAAVVAEIVIGEVPAGITVRQLKVRGGVLFL
jgi:hypothetical protein